MSRRQKYVLAILLSAVLLGTIPVAASEAVLARRAVDAVNSVSDDVCNAHSPDGQAALERLRLLRSFLSEEQREHLPDCARRIAEEPDQRSFLARHLAALSLL